MGELEQKIQERIAMLEENDKPVMIFGRDIRKVPCFKQGFITGIISGLGAGIVTFMFTSRTRLASHATMGVFGVLTIGSFTVCRYQFVKEKLMIDRMKSMMKEAVEAEGLEHDKKVEEVVKLVEV